MKIGRMNPVGRAIIRMGQAAFGTLPTNIEAATVPLTRVEAFVAGDYNEKGEFGSEFLDALAENYNPNGLHEAPVTLDHAQDGPSYGWVKRVWREGKSLFMDMHVTRAMADAIKAGAFKKRSIEFYRDFLGTGKPMIRAITFLGAGIPHAKGMTDIKLSEGIILRAAGPLKFDQNCGEFVSIDVPESASPIGMSELPADPDPSGHGVIESEERTSQVLGHWHDAYLDEEGNGFTGPAICYEDGYWDTGGMDEDEPHVHLIKAGVVSPAGPDPGHTHPLTLIQRYHEQQNEKEHMMKGSIVPTNPAGGAASTPPAGAGTAPATAPTAEQFAELSTQVSNLATQVTTFSADAKREKERADKLEADLMSERTQNSFDKVFDECVREGRIEPGQKADLFIEYQIIPAGTVKLGEVEVDGRKRFLDNLAKRPVVMEFSQRIAKGGDGGSEQRQLQGEDPNAKAKHAKVETYMSEKKVDYNTALLAVTQQEEAAKQ